MLTTILLTVAMSGSGDMPKIVVRPKPAPAVVVPDPPPVKKAAEPSGCNCAYCLCQTEKKAKAPAPVATPVVPKQTIVISSRAPSGHTHTCSRCQTTWDHSITPGHNCPRCGTAQYVQDSRPRPVTITRTTSVQSAPVAAPARFPIELFGGSSGGCPGGNCSNLRRSP